MSDGTLDVLLFAVFVLAASAFFWWVGWFPQRLKKRRLRRWRDWADSR
jgi:hypothetical protein